MRGPFSREVLELMRISGSVSYHYIFLPISPVVCLSLDSILAACKARAPARMVLSLFFNQVVALELLYFPAVGILFTWIARRGLWLGNCRCKLALEIFFIQVLSVFASVAGASMGVIVAARSLEVTLLWNVFAIVFAAVVWRFCWHAK